MAHHEHDQIKHQLKITVRHKHDHTEATAHMHWRHSDLAGVGEADLDPSGRYPKHIGEELAIARALTHLTRQMFITTPGDVVSVVGEDN